MVKPVLQTNVLRQRILGSLLDDHVKQEPRLARNVSWLNVDRASARWIK